MLERYSTASEENSQADLPESKSLRADNKTFYFDCGSNQRGSFLKISEVRQNRYRTSITIPDKYLRQFKDQINEFIEKSASNEHNESNEQVSVLLSASAAITEKVAKIEEAKK